MNKKITELTNKICTLLNSIPGCVFTSKMLLSIEKEDDTMVFEFTCKKKNIIKQIAYFGNDIGNNIEFCCYDGKTVYYDMFVELNAKSLQKTIQFLENVR